MESAHSAYSAVEPANSVFLCTLSSCTGSGYLMSDVLFLTEWSHSAYSAMEPADSVFLCVLGSCTGSGFLVSAVQFLIERAHSADSAMESVSRSWSARSALAQDPNFFFFAELRCVRRREQLQHGLLMACFMGLHAGPVCVGTHLICC